MRSKRDVRSGWTEPGEAPGKEYGKLRMSAFFRFKFKLGLWGGEVEHCVR